MGKQEFVHLHAHSDYSLLDGCARFSDDKGEPTPMMTELASWGFKHQALTDHGNMFGAIEFYQSCKTVGINPIIGCELYVARGSRLDRKTTVKDDENPQKTGINHLTVLAKNNVGYQNLIELNTKASLEGFYYKPRADKELLAMHHEGLIALSGCLKGEVAQAIMADNIELATQRAKDLENTFGKGNFYLEIMDHGMEAQRKVGKALLEISQKTGIPLVATNDCHYFLKADATSHDALLCIGTGKKVEDVKRMRYASQEFYYKAPEEMHKLFQLYPETIANTLRIAESCNISIPFNELHLPDYKVPEGYNKDTYLEMLCREGFKKRLSGDVPTKYQERLSTELSVIKKMGFQGYFLIVWDFINFARKNNVPVGPGRGSGAGSIVSYLLNITSVDPIAHGLLFERFLNPDRRSMPDLDIDFSDEGRELVINYVREKYGFMNVAPIITFGTMQSRSVIRDIGRVLNIPIGEVDKIAKTVPQGLSIEAALNKSQELATLHKNSETVRRILALAVRLEGCRRHTGIHAAGIVITKEPVTKYAPLYKNQTSGVISTGFNDESLVRLGLLKVDFLGLRTLTVIQSTVNLIAAQRNIHIDIEKIPYDDPKAFALLGKAQSGGMFQLESRGMRDLLLRLQPNKLSEIIALIALFRPGPMKWIDDYVARKHNPNLVRYEHPKLEPILKETYGICLYQEQVMQISKELAGFSSGEADKLRKAMGKKIPEELNKLEEKFVEGSKKNGVDPKLAKKLYEDLKDFGHYAFNKSHSAAYGIVAYQTAYLKANYPLEFMAALVSCEIGRSAVGSDDKENKIATYLTEAKAMGFAVLPPSINESHKKFSIEQNGIRFALLAIKNMGEIAVDEIIAKREAKGPFESLKDLFQRVGGSAINRKVFEALAKSGALDSVLEGNSLQQKRAGFVVNVDTHINHWSQNTQDMLFEIEAPVSIAVANQPAASSTDEILQWERETLGVYISDHPLERWSKLLESLPVTALKDIKKRAGDDSFWIAGLTMNLQKLVSKKTGQPWARMKLEDLTAEMDIVLFPRAYGRAKPETIRSGAFLVARGRPAQKLGGEDAAVAEEEFFVDELLTLENFLANHADSVEIVAATVDENTPQQIKNILASQSSGSTRVLIRLGTHLIELPQKILLTKEFWIQMNPFSNSMIISIKDGRFNETPAYRRR